MTSRAAGDEDIRVLLVDDHTILREGIHSLLAREPISMSWERPPTVARRSTRWRDWQRHVVIMDLVMPHMNGLEATRLIGERHPDVRILILSMYDDDEYVREIIQAGASGYVLKRVATDDLVKAIHEVHRGSSFLYPPIAAKLIDYVRSVQGGDDVESLTPREREVVTLIAEGNTNQGIAKILGLSRKTVESHRANIMRKLEVHDVTDLVKYAIRKGLTTLG